MTATIPHRCPCGLVIGVRVRDTAGAYTAEFLDGDTPIDLCECGEGLYELLAGGHLKPLPEEPPHGPRPADL